MDKLGRYMSRRGFVFIIGFLVVALLVIVFVRPFSETSEVSQQAVPPAAEEGTDQDSAMAQEAPAVNTGSKKPSSVSETSAASSDPGAFYGRGARRDRPVGGEKSFNARNAVVTEDAFFAGSPWKIWKGVTAYPKSRGEPEGRLLGQVNGYYLVDEDVPVSLENFDPAKPIVVLIQDGTGRAGVVTGTFTVVLEEGASADFLTQSPPIKVVGASPETQTYFVTSAQVPFNLREFLEALREAPEVRSVQPEISDRQYEKF